MATKLVHNVETGEVSEVELTSQELAQLEADKNEKAKESQELKAKQDAKSAIADRLGLTPDELATLLA
jgi:hypothetical protein